MFDVAVLIEDFIQVWTVVPQTLLLALIILFISLLLGSLLAAIQRVNIPVVSQIITVLQSFIRGTPNVVMLYLGYYALPVIAAYFFSLLGFNYNGDHLHPALIVIITFSISFSVFQSETIRGALNSIDRGQIEAASSLGYCFTQTIRKVIIPQALVEALPDIMNSFLVIIKALSLAFLVTVVDIFAQAKLLGAYNYRYVEAFIAAAFVYWIICSFFTLIINKVENRLRRGYE